MNRRQFIKRAFGYGVCLVIPTVVIAKEPSYFLGKGTVRFLDVGEGGGPEECWKEIGNTHTFPLDEITKEQLELALGSIDKNYTFTGTLSGGLDD